MSAGILLVVTDDVGEEDRAAFERIAGAHAASPAFARTMAALQEVRSLQVRPDLHELA